MAGARLTTTDRAERAPIVFGVVKLSGRLDARRYHERDDELPTYTGHFTGRLAVNRTRDLLGSSAATSVPVITERASTSQTKHLSRSVEIRPLFFSRASSVFAAYGKSSHCFPAYGMSLAYSLTAAFHYATQVADLVCDMVAGLLAHASSLLASR